MTSATSATLSSEPTWTASGLAERRAWAALAIGSLATAGVFALLLAVSRLPGIEKVFPWPLNFFGKGLVIHVIFSLIVWFLNVFALLSALATVQLPGEPRFNWLGGAGAVLSALAFPLLFLPAFTDADPSLNNYIPVIQHPVYYAGLAVLGAGVLLPSLRLLLNLRGPFRDLPPLAAAMTAGAVIFIVALGCFAWTAALSWGETPSVTINEQMFWAGGHVLQFLFCLLMVTGWFILGRSSLGDGAMDAGTFRIAVLLLAFFVLPAPFLIKIFGIASPWYREAFSKLQFIMALPTLLVGAGAVAAMMRAPALPWRNTAFVALFLSLVVFGVGGLMGNLITGSDTRTPAHYHGVITGVNLAVMGLVLTFCLPAAGKAIRGGAGVRAFIWLYGLGQLLAILGLFWAGGYGAPRKTPTAVSDLVDGAVMGMYVHGIGALLAVAGGVLFVITVIRALARPAFNQQPPELPAV